MSWQELLFLAVLIVVLIRPKDMPMLMRQAGLFVGSLKRTVAEFQHEIERTETNLRIQFEELLEIEKNTPLEDIQQKKQSPKRKASVKKAAKKGKKNGRS